MAFNFGGILNGIDRVAGAVEKVAPAVQKTITLLKKKGQVTEAQLAPQVNVQVAQPSGLSIGKVAMIGGGLLLVIYLLKR